MVCTGSLVTTAGVASYTARTEKAIWSQFDRLFRSETECACVDDWRRREGSFCSCIYLRAKNTYLGDFLDTYDTMF
jgi:hypothetical protein